MLQRAYSLMEIKAIEESEDHWTIQGIATTPKPDRFRDIVEPLGAEFADDLPLLWQHRASEPVGRVQFDKPTKKGIKFVAQIPKVKEAGILKDRIEEAYQSIKYRLVAAVSIGFRVIDDALEFMENGGIRYLKTEIVELSLVTIPANVDATITNIKSLDRTIRAALGQRPIVSVRDSAILAGDTAPKHSKSFSVREGQSMKNLSEQITKFENKRAAIEARLEELLSKAAEEERTFDGEEQEEYDNLEAERAAIDDHLVRLRKHESSMAQRARPVDVARVGTVDGGSEARSPVILPGRDVLPKGVEFARYARCLILARGNLMQAHEIAKHNFRDNTRVVNVLKAAVAAGTTTDTTWAAPLVDYTTLASEFIEYLRPQTILGKFGTNGIPALRQIPFNVRMGRQTSGGSGGWVGEGKPKPLTKLDYAEVTLRWAKVANIAVITEELARFSNPSADTLIRQALADALRERLDIDFVDPDKAEDPNVSPASIINGVVGITSAGTDDEAVKADVQAIMQKFIDAKLTPSSGVWIMSMQNALALSLMQTPLGQPRFPGITMNGGTFMGFPVITSEYLNTVADSSGSPMILVNANDVFLADDGGVTIDASREASLEMADDPTSDSTTPTETTLVSMFQTNSIALRAERVVNWKKRRAEAAFYVGNAAYDASTAT